MQHYFRNKFIMMESLRIKNFKNLKELTIERLSRVNLIVGKNNVGKSSLLEAVSIYITNGEENWLREILADRGEEIRNADGDRIDAENVKLHYISLFSEWEENYSKDFEIEIGTNDKNEIPVRISQVYIREGKMGRTSTSFEAIHKEMIGVQVDRNTITSAGLLVTSGSQSNIIPYNKERSYLNSFNEKYPFQYIPLFMIGRFANAKLFDKISLSPDEDYVLDALRIINQDINRIRFIDTNEGRNSERIAVVTVKGSDKRYRLSSMGDGINRILTIILALLNCKDGVLLLDEFETGLHYSVQDQLWEIIFMLSEKLNVQVFVTTHSNDCVGSFTRTNPGVGQLIRLVNHEGSIIPTILDDTEELRFASNNSVEMR